MNKTEAKKSFTLIEVMIVIAIIGIMAVVILTFIGQNKHTAQLEASANLVVSVIRKAQNYSLTGKDITKDCLDYAIIATNNSSIFSLVNGSYDGGSMQNISGQCPIILDFKLNEGVVFSGDYLLSFRAPFADNLTIPEGSTEDIIISKGTESYHICINSAGVVTMQKNSC